MSVACRNFMIKTVKNHRSIFSCVTLAGLLLSSSPNVPLAAEEERVEVVETPQAIGGI